MNTSPHQSGPGAALAALESARHALDHARSEMLALATASEKLKRDFEQSQALGEELKARVEAQAIELSGFQAQNAFLTEKISEVTRKKADEDEQNARLQGQLAQMHNLMRLQTQGGDLPGLILELAIQLTGAEVGLCTESDGDDTLASWGFDSLPEELVEPLYDYSRRVAVSQEPLVENDAEKLPDGAGVVNLAALPVMAQGTRRGVLLLANKRTGPFTENDSRVLLAIGQHAGVALENCRLHAQLHESSAATVAVLADAIEAKDAYTRGHCEKVSSLAVEVGRRLGMEHEAVEELRYAALLHDVGKIGVPDGVLLKPGKLLPEEFSIIQKHSQIGRDIVARVPRFLGICDTILHHHEHYNGAGYPAGLAGEGIPIGSRIIGAVDAFDAMTGTRPYRQPLEASVAFAELQRCCGSQFDPGVVQILGEVLVEKGAIYNFAA